MDRQRRFFFYGTLVAGCDNPVTRALRGKLSDGLAATTRGELYAITVPDGSYPALIADPAGGLVHGFVYEALSGFTEADLALLDRWEDCDPAAPEASEYHRVSITVAPAGGGAGGVRAQIVEAYVYARALPAGAERIEQGDFAAFVRTRGLSAIGSRG